MHFPQQAYQHDSPDLASRQRVAQKRAAETVGWNDGRMAADPRSLFPGKHFISAILDALDTKTEMSGLIARRYLMRAGMAGMLIGVFYVANYTVMGAFAQVGGDGELTTIGRLAGALTFGWALVFIYYTRSELLTSNMMIVSIGHYYRRVSLGRSLRLLAMCLGGNFLGGLLVAVLLRFSSILDGVTGDLARLSVEHKLDYVTSLSGAGDLFVRAILCNFLINVAMLMVYNGYVKDDLTKSLVMIVAVALFAYLGFEHSVANTVLFSIAGLDGGLGLGAGEVGLAAANVGIALTGNFVGGGLLIGWYYAYCNDDRKYATSA